MKFHASLRDVHGDHVFHVKDGPKLRNLYELERELRRMNDLQFAHHVNNAKNDFYNWVFHIVRDEDLASNLSQIRERVAMADVVEKRITKLEKGMVNEAVTPETPKVEKAKPVKAVKAAPVKKAVKAQVKEIKPAPVAKPAPKICKTPPKICPAIPQVELPNNYAPLPSLPEVTPLPLTFEEVEARIQSKLGTYASKPFQPVRNDPIHEQPITPELPVHHRIKAHVKTYAVHYGLGAGVLLGLAIAKYFI